MKKSKIVLAVLLTVMIGFTACSSDDNGKANNVEQINEKQLPEQSKSFIKSVFPNASFRHVAKVTKPNYYGTTYASSLDNRVEIDFDNAGNWTEVEMSDNSALPIGFLKSEVPHILEFVNKNHKGQSIIELDRNIKKGFEITLNNNLELIFNLKQEFVGVDLDLDKDETLINASELPQLAQNFLKEYFNTANIVLVKHELDKEGDEYKVYLSNGFKIEFNQVGEWLQVETRRMETIPLALIPVRAMTYINSNYSAFKIESIEREQANYQIELVNGKQEVELLFDREGNFLRKDN
ncbi:PepSY-like domain-containing protein [Myroides sp. M-43]|uniref:PepSY-like domain-containing protein n=1 Tax=Myroides oncorhynchi TaxID=2893756 RepID=UPI001E3176E4|nr:PepSY-like domain-containing protein [Myroides oncorhynchi]MCC9044419.1 PepSY-like domain-containing protein [Myroides oncorhynchi]